MFALCEQQKKKHQKEKNKKRRNCFLDRSEQKRHCRDRSECIHNNNFRFQWAKTLYSSPCFVFCLFFMRDQLKIIECRLSILQILIENREKNRHEIRFYRSKWRGECFVLFSFSNFSLRFVAVVVIFARFDVGNKSHSKKNNAQDVESIEKHANNIVQ